MSFWGIENSPRPNMAAGGKWRHGRTADQHAGIACRRHQPNRAKGSREELPCRVQGQRPLWGLGQRPNSSTGDQYAKRAQQRCRQRSAPASNSALPQERPRAALPPRFREELAFSCSFMRLTVIILPSVSFSTSACRSAVRPRLPSPPQPCWVAGDFLFPQTTKKRPRLSRIKG